MAYRNIIVFTYQLINMNELNAMNAMNVCVCVCVMENKNTKLWLLPSLIVHFAIQSTRKRIKIEQQMVRIERIVHKVAAKSTKFIVDEHNKITIRERFQWSAYVALHVLAVGVELLG